MLSPRLIKCRGFFLFSPCFCGWRNFYWNEFLLPSSLQLSESIEILLQPIKGKSTVKIKLGLHEALVNAVKHGNIEDKSKFIRIRLILTPNWFVWQIQDQGNGLPIEKRYFSLPKDLDADSGRGLFIIHQCFDDVRWSQKGNRIQLAANRKSSSDQGNLDLLSLP